MSLLSNLRAVLLAGLFAADAVTAVAAPASAAEGWMCSVPAGHTYDRVERVVSTCGSGFMPRYNVRQPADLLVACLLPQGYTYDTVDRSTSCSTSGMGPRYRLRTPAVGLWACTVPSGWTYTASERTTGCSTSGLAWRYRLTR
ncbi:hypothetical protein PV646_18000 [Streptomyces sp. ID05-26A]|nr:hypothetical protein [Streptomyces sp. ID05-26A]